ncbi:MAG: hypothetical protein DMD37_07500 [Gemmatimonadetes bacterium]|nr:MAG: hypothetical protein DMD74_03520 [Gemmatimonadota bacterium]PYO69028.1 MAG: hypothetical protein DMD71_05225 [Gemmatimonadota bacterium]PYO86245.1 MAG: hypothetical protein DMD68_00675 [Gemmatimonadota bacterium]PYP63100.1 MAG: hypothetical protein DMD37_07500 [Gemmatimonadota bacterium]
MDLLQQVAANLKVEEGKAEKGIGAMLMALRMALPKETFEQVKNAIPNSERMMGHALMSGSRTGELAVATGPSGLLAALAAAGINKSDVPRLGRMVLEHVRSVIGAPALDRFLETHPALKG